MIASYYAFRAYRRGHVVDLDPSLIAHEADLRVMHPDNTAALIEEARRKRIALREENFSVGDSQGTN
jgi:hypothetical protein